MAEDDPIIGVLLGDVLVGLGHEVCAIVDTEAETIESALTLKPDLMIVDARLGAGSGPEAVARILDHVYIPHIFISGDVTTLRRLGLHAVVLEKPFNEADLHGAISLAIRADGTASIECRDCTHP